MSENTLHRPAAATCLMMVTAALLLTFAPGAHAQDYGSTAFENSGAEDAQASFLTGLLMLHSFEYEDAREAFREAQQIDPAFAMAYWGEAMTYNHPVWFSQDQAAATKALERLAESPDERLERARTPREREYLRAIHVLYGEGTKESRDDAFERAMAGLAAAYPDDLDAAAFHALSILGTSHEGRDFATYMRAAAVAEDVFAENPRHPGAAHYLIHSYDDPIHAPLGLRAARAYSDIAPSAAHAQHMPSHIFVALGMWDEVVESNEASWAASEQRVAQKNLGANDRGFHALLWLTYGYLQQGRYMEADSLIRIMIDTHQEAGTGRTAYHLSAMRAAYVVETEQWDSRAADAEVDLEALGRETRATELFTRGIVGLGRNNLEVSSAALSALRAIEGLDDEDNDAARARAMGHQLQGLIDYEEGRPDEALASLRKAAAIEDETPFDYGPPSPVKPSYELIGDILLREGAADDALEAYRRALVSAPGRARSLEGVAAAAELLGLRRESQQAISQIHELRKRGE